MSRDSGQYCGGRKWGFMAIPCVTNSFTYKLIGWVNRVMVLASAGFFHSQEVIYVRLSGRKGETYSVVSSLLSCTLSWTISVLAPFPNISSNK